MYELLEMLYENYCFVKAKELYHGNRNVKESVLKGIR